MCKKRKEKKTVYWDLINSNLNKRDVHCNTGGENISFTVNNLVSVYETGYVLRSPMA